MKRIDQMTMLEMTPEQREALAGVLDNYLSDLHYEIADTDSSEFKHMLRHRQKILTQIADEVRTREPAPASC